MLLQRYMEWKESQVIPRKKIESIRGQPEENDFSIFFQHDCVGNGFMDILSKLAFEVYELQFCVEGILEDLEMI